MESKSVTVGLIEYRELPAMGYDVKRKIIYWLSTFELKVKEEFKDRCTIILNRNLGNGLYDIFVKFDNVTFKLSNALSYYLDKPETYCEYVTFKKLATKRIKTNELDSLLAVNKDTLPIIGINAQESKYSQVYLKSE